MMKLTKTGLGLLNAQYKSVLKKCFLINCGLFALGVANASEAKAEILPTLGENSVYTFSLTDNPTPISLTVDENTYEFKLKDVGTGDNYFYYKWTTDENNNIKLTAGTESDYDLAVSYVAPSHERITTGTGGADVNADFYLLSTSDRGGAIYNFTTSIGKIKGNFIENSASGLGGNAIYNQLYTLPDIAGKFVANYGGQQGGAIRNSGSITNIEASFIGNSATSQGGAILHYLYTIDTIKADFIGNSIDNNGASSGAGGAIMNSSATINKIEGDYISNYVFGLSAGGGAIYNAGSIKSINANFMLNYVKGKLGSSGGAIRNEGRIGGMDEEGNLTGGIINSSFINNYAMSESGTAQGGAIYTSDSLNIIAENGTSTFQGNYVQDGEGEKDYQAIWVDSAAETLTFAARENGEIFMYDNVNGVETTTTDPESGEEITSRYKVNITGDGTGAMHLYNDIKNADVSVNNTTLEIGVSPVEMKNVTFAADSTLALKVNSLDEYGSLTAETITVDQGATLNATLAQGIVKIGQQETLQLLKADNTDFNNFADSFDNNMYHFKKDGKNGAYTIKLVKTAEEIVNENGGDQNQAEAAAAWVDANPFAPGSVAAQIADTLADLAQNKPAELVDNLIVLAPEEAPLLQQTVTDTTDAIFGAVGTRLSGGSVVSSQGISSGDNPFADVVLWIQGLANHAKYSANKHSKGFDSDTFGAAMGIEKHIDNYVKFGVGYAYSKTDVNGFKRDTDVKTHTAILYGEYKPSSWFVNAVASYGWSDYDETKHFNNKNIKFNYDVRTLGLQALTGYDFDTAYAQITPQAGMRYLHIHRGGAVDSAEQNISDDDIDVVTAVLGAKLSKTYKTYNGVLLTPEFRAAMTYDVSHDDTHATVTLPNGASYNVIGKALNRFGVEVGGGVTAELNDQVEFSLGYEGRFRSHYQDHTGLIGLKYKF